MSTQARLEFEKLRRELRKADNDKHRAAALDGINRLLDKHLEQRGAHKPSCRCERCAPVTDRFMGECVCADDVASETEFGPLGMDAP
jgi:hypothetical protein